MYEAYSCFQVLQTLMPIMMNRNEETSVRVAAFVVLMKCRSSTPLVELQKCLNEEPDENCLEKQQQQDQRQYVLFSFITSINTTAHQLYQETFRVHFICPIMFQPNENQRDLEICESLPHVLQNLRLADVVRMELSRRNDQD